MPSSEPPARQEFVTIDVQLGSQDWQLRTQMTVPSGPTRLRQMLPLLQSFADAVVDVGAKQVEDKGQKISCKKGCGACCRQLVPISEVEARRVRDLVEDLPEPRRAEIRARFAEARRRLDTAGLLDKLLHRDQWSDGDGQDVALKYFFQGIPCPFLEEESCSIHPDRPITCREYLVTSPAENCANPTPETVDRIRLPLKVWTAVARMDKVPPSAHFIRWVPLSLAPEWADAHPDESPARPGPELLRELFEYMTRTARQPQQPAPAPLDPEIAPAPSPE